MPGKLLSKRCYPAHLHKPFGYRGKRKLDAEQADECQDEGVRQGHPHHAAIREANQWRECRGQQEQERSLTVRRSDGEQIYGVKCGDEVIKADAYVMAFGSYSTAMLKGIVDIPVYPLKGYSLTIPIAQEDGAPVSTILDETYKIAITRFDNRIRVGGMAEIVGFNTELLQPRRETLEMVVRDLYPRGGHVEQATFWTGLRPMTPDGTPVVGRTRFKNLWLNTGHGTLGWTMACGSGQLLSDLLSGRTPAIPYEDLSVARYSRGFTPSRPGHLHGAHS